MAACEPPAWLSDSQRECWDHAVRSLPRRALDRADRGLLTAWAVAEDTHRIAAEQVSRGLLINVPGVPTPQVSPYLAIVDRQSAILARIAAELGFSPVSRAREKASAMGPIVLGRLGVESAGELTQALGGASAGEGGF